MWSTIRTRVASAASRAARPAVLGPLAGVGAATAYAASNTVFASDNVLKPTPMPWCESLPSAPSREGRSHVEAPPPQLSRSRHLGSSCELQGGAGTPLQAPPARPVSLGGVQVQTV